jgi:hypothetical protein
VAQTITSELSDDSDTLEHFETRLMQAAHSVPAALHLRQPA